MAKYDDASWHYGGDYPEDLDQECAATHIGMFLAWCINNDLLSEEEMDDCEESIKAVKNRTKTGAKFLLEDCDEKFCDFDLNELGQQFANAYYEEDTLFGHLYLDDFCETFNNKAENDFEYETLYHVEDTWENYDLIKMLIDQRFQEWNK